MADPLIFARGVHFAATLLACGTAVFVVFVAEPAGTKVRARFAALRHQFTVLIWLELAAAILSGVAWLVLLASDILGTSFVDVCLHGRAWPVLFDTRFGLVWCARLALALLLGLLMLRPAMRSLQVAIAAALVALPALVGHAGATPGAAGNFHLVSDAVHLLAAGAWIGGLPAFAWSLSQARGAAGPAWSDFAIRVTRRFSVVGILSVGALLASGLVNSWYLLSGPRDLLTTDYGRLVAFKIGLFAAMVAFAAVNRFYLTPQLPKRTALLALQRNSLAEIFLGLGVLLFVGMLGTRAPSAHAHAVPEGIPPGAAFVHIHAPEAMADVTIDPGRAGLADATIRVMREDFSRFPAKDVHLALEPPTPRSPTLERDAVEQANGAWLVSDIALAEPGIWTVRVIVTSQLGEAIMLDAPIVIER
jgi:copper resistance protein D